VFDLIFPYLANRLAGKNVSEMTYFVSGGRKTLTQSILVLLELSSSSNF